jgi:tetratricopeptide (TPR) repeat protein
VASRKAIALQPNNAQAYTHLGTSLVGQEKHTQAEAAYHQAIALDPDFPETRFLLGWALMHQARFDEAADALKKADTLLPANHPGREKVRELQQQCQRYLALDARLPAILRGTDKPANAAEQLEFGDLCIRKRLYAAAARFCADAFTADPKLAEDVPAGTRYNAACVAAVAGCGRSKDSDQVDDNGRARLRRQALGWLRQDLTWWGKALDKGNAETRAQVIQKLRDWQSDDDLAGLRDPGRLGALPPDERRECLALWQEVATVLGRAQATK